jgi:hypothetical protein
MSEQALTAEREELLAEARAIGNRADQEGRELSRRERSRCEAILEKADEYAGYIQSHRHIAEIGGEAPDILPAGFAAGGGWNEVASKIAVDRRGHFKMEAQSLLQTKTAPVMSKAGRAGRKSLDDVDLVEGNRLELATTSVLGRDRRFLYPLLAQQPT